MAVFNAAGVQLGYLTAERAPLIGRFIEEGRPIEAAFQRRAEFGCWIRIAFDGETLVLPDERGVDEGRPTRTVVRDEFDQREYEE